MRLVSIFVTGCLIGSFWGTAISFSREYIHILGLSFMTLTLFPEEKK